VNRLVAVALAGALAACNPKPTMATGGITIGAGILISQIPDECDEKLLCFENTEIGTFIALIGLAILAIGVVGYAGEQKKPQPMMLAPGMVPPPGYTVAPPPPFPVTELPVEPPRPDEPPLPALELSYQTSTERQFAIQAGSAARRGKCSAAVASGNQLRMDLRQQLVAVDAAYARCVVTAP